MKRHDTLAFDQHAPAGYVARLAILVMAMLLMPAPAFAQTAGAPKGNPRLASLNIEIWPEYDRPAALVILKGVLAEGVKLPAVVTLRLPAAVRRCGGGRLFRLRRTATCSTCSTSAPTPATTSRSSSRRRSGSSTSSSTSRSRPAVPARSYRYVWPGDLAVERVSVVVQEPASASDIVGGAESRGHLLGPGGPALPGRQTWARLRRASRCRSRCATPRRTCGRRPKS